MSKNPFIKSQILSSRGTQLNLKLSNVILELELKENLTDLEIVQIESPSIFTFYEEWRKKNLSFFIFNRETIQVPLPDSIIIEARYIDGTYKEFEVQSLIIKKILPLRLTPAERHEVTEWVDDCIRDCGLSEISLFNLPKNPDDYLRELSQAFQENKRENFQLVLDELIRNKYELLLKVEQRLDEGDKGHKIIHLILTKIFLGDLFYFFIKVPELFIPEAHEFKSQYRATYQFFNRFFEKQRRVNKSIYMDSGALSSLLEEKLGSIVHDLLIVSSHDPIKVPTSFMRSASTLISDIYEIVKQVLQTIDRLFPNTKLTRSLNPSSFSDPALDAILRDHLDRILRNHRFHESIEWVDGAGRINAKDGTSHIYTLTEIEDKVAQSLALFFIIYETFWINYLDVITVRIPEEPITVSFQIILRAIKENLEIFPWVSKYFLLYFSSFVNNPLFQENIQGLIDESSERSRN